MNGVKPTWIKQTVPQTKNVPHQDKGTPQPSLKAAKRYGPKTVRK